MFTATSCTPPGSLQPADKHLAAHVLCPRGQGHTWLYTGWLATAVSGADESPAEALHSCNLQLSSRVSSIGAVLLLSSMLCS